MNILLVDDNRYTLQGLLDGIDFKELGFADVYTSCSAAGAKEILRQNRIEIVITDIEMPGGTGLELLEKRQRSGKMTKGQRNMAVTGWITNITSKRISGINIYTGFRKSRRRSFGRK